MIQTYTIHHIYFKCIRIISCTIQLYSFISPWSLSSIYSYIYLLLKFNRLCLLCASLCFRNLFSPERVRAAPVGVELDRSRAEFQCRVCMCACVMRVCVCVWGQATMCLPPPIPPNGLMIERQRTIYNTQWVAVRLDTATSFISHIHTLVYRRPRTEREGKTLFRCIKDMGFWDTWVGVKVYMMRNARGILRGWWSIGRCDPRSTYVYTIHDLCDWWAWVYVCVCF